MAHGMKQPENQLYMKKICNVYKSHMDNKENMFLLIQKGMIKKCENEV